MMRLTISGIILAIMTCTLSGNCQLTRERNEAFWTWFQLEKRLSGGQQLELQYQARFNQNNSRIGKNNLYFSYGLYLPLNLQMECLYQLATNSKINQHTFYFGLTHKTKMSSNLFLFYRMAFQTMRNYFTSDYHLDHPYSEWRNRLRLAYKINSGFSAAFSAEPYLKFTRDHPVHLSRIRLVGQFNYKYNKYFSFTAFYLVEPDVVVYSKPETDFVYGITTRFRIPNKLKKFEKLFKPRKIKDNKNENETIHDTYN